MNEEFAREGVKGGSVQGRWLWVFMHSVASSVGSVCFGFLTVSLQTCGFVVVVQTHSHFNLFVQFPIVITISSRVFFSAEHVSAHMHLYINDLLHPLLISICLILLISRIKMWLHNTLQLKNLQTRLPSPLY